MEWESELVSDVAAVAARLVSVQYDPSGDASFVESELASKSESETVEPEQTLQGSDLGPASGWYVAAPGFLHEHWIQRAGL